MKMVTLGSGATREVEDRQLSRYACYLIVQNADPDKPIVALGQTYFATQTRAAEVTQEQERIYLRDQRTERNKSLAAGAYEVGVVSARDFAIFADHSYMGLYNGEKTADVHARKGPKKSQHILDWMEAEEVAANFFSATQADAKIRREGASGKDEANEIHREAGRIVRRAITELGGTAPEELPTPAESIQQLRRREAKRLQSGPSLWDEAGEEEARCLRSG
jgi:DNA-damage-inducible protein D